jgi:lipopolysaccharide/colanic/teichoic acid biosynthesis glycosyltransferase
MLWFYKSKGQYFKNLFQVFFGKISFVGYAKIHHASNLKLPSIKKGILSSLMMVPASNLDEAAISRLNLIYAKNHSFVMDLKIVFRNLRGLDC